jgi:hypothetical protein
MHGQWLIFDSYSLEMGIVHKIQCVNKGKRAPTNCMRNCFVMPLCWIFD